MLAQTESWNVLRDSPAYEDYERTKDVLEFCFERGLHEQASCGIRITSTFDLTKDIEIMLFRYILCHGRSQPWREI